MTQLSHRRVSSSGHSVIANPSFPKMFRNSLAQDHARNGFEIRSVKNIALNWSPDSLSTVHEISSATGGVWSLSCADSSDGEPKITRTTLTTGMADYWATIYSDGKSYC